MDILKIIVKYIYEISIWASLSSLWGEEQDGDASNGCLCEPNSQYAGNKQLPLDVLKLLLPVDNWTNLERFTLDLAALLFVLIFEVNLHIDMVAVWFGSISIRNNSFRACVSVLYFACVICLQVWPIQLLVPLRRALT